MRRPGVESAVVAIAALLVVLSAGCATRPTSSAETAATGPRLLPIASWPVDLSLRQRVRIRWGEQPDEEARFDAVLEKRGGVLLLVGLDPLARPGFVLRAEAAAIDVTNRSGRPLPFDPAHVLADVQRVFYPWRADAIPEDVLLTEAYAGRRVARRSFSRRDDPDAGVIRVSYEDGWLDPSGVPRRAVVENQWYGYTLEVETLEATALPATPAGGGEMGGEGGAGAD